MGKFGAEDVAESNACLACIRCWVPSHTLGKPGVVVCSWQHHHLEMEVGGSEVQGRPLAMTEFEARLGYMKPRDSCAMH